MGFSGLRVLVVEDDFVLAETLIDLLSLSGCKTVSSAGTLADALQAAKSADIDLALVDFYLHQETSEPLLEVLTHEGIPFVIATCADDEEIPGSFRHMNRVTKPYSIEQLTSSVAAAMANDCGTG